MAEVASQLRNSLGSPSHSSGTRILERRPIQTEHQLVCSKCRKTFGRDYELRRHMDTQHSSKRKMWICVDPDPARNLLSHCRHCVQQKQYHVDYNAAAHLRRVHFKSEEARDRLREIFGEPDGDERRPGWPPMDRLKPFIKEVEVNVPGWTEHDMEEGDDDMMVDDNDTYEDPFLDTTSEIGFFSSTGRLAPDHMPIFGSTTLAPSLSENVMSHSAPSAR